MTLLLEKQVPSLELCKELKELGFGSDTAFTWVKDFNTGEYKLQTFYTQFFGMVTNYHAAGMEDTKNPMFPAPTVAELGEALKVFSDKFPRYDEKKKIWYLNFRGGFPIHFDFSTEAFARAKMLIYLLKNKLV